MSFSWTTKELQEALRISIPTKITAHKIEFNSLDITHGDIFIALTKGQRNGHHFIKDALDRGAGAIISAQSYNDPRIIKVEDTEAALYDLAQYKRVHSRAKFIGITGSAGKTSTKEITNSLLSNFGSSFTNKGSFNNHIGLPLTLASTPLDTDFVTLELGMNASGEIRSLSKIARPDIAIITNIGEAHLEQLGTTENICRAKCEIFEYLFGQKIAIVNIDSPHFILQKTIIESLGVKMLTFGESSNANCVLKNFEMTAVGNKVIYSIMGEEIEAMTHLYGKHQAVNICAPLLAIKVLGLDIKKTPAMISSLPTYKGRGQITEIKLGSAKISLIDDAYNANPSSMKASLSALSSKEGKKIAILADMKELGPRAQELHIELKQYVIDAKLNFLYTFGDLMKGLNEDLANTIPSKHFDRVSDEAFAEIIQKAGIEDCIILVKGSNSTNINKFIEYLGLFSS